MKVVILHDWLVGFRGGERVLEALCEMFPDAPIYTLIHEPGSTSPLIESRRIVTSFLQKLPIKKGRYRFLLPLMPMAADAMKIEPCDVVISSSHCVIKGVKKPRGTFHLSYIHSPMRYLYDQYENYFGPGAPWIQRLGMWFVRGYLQRWDIRSNSNVDLLVANSGFVEQRIKKYYGKSAEVVFPFVDLEDIARRLPAQLQKHDYFVVVSAFAPNKRVDMAIRAMKLTHQKLRIIGSGQQEKQLRALVEELGLKDHVQFLGNCSRDEVIKNLAEAKALIFPGVEDFGITPLESLACGTPVVAFAAGGVLETLTGKTADFFNEPTAEALSDCLLGFNPSRFEKEALVERAHKFSKAQFTKNISALLDARLQAKRGEA